MQILVIGGTRFVGRAIVQRLLTDGHGVTLFNRGRTPDTFGTRVSRIVGDRSDPDAWRQALARRTYDAVIDVIASRQEHTRQAAGALAGRIGHFIHISTASVYLIREGLFCPFREGDFAGRLTPRTAANKATWLYAYHKRCCESALQEAWENDRLPFTSLRLPMVVGPGDYTDRFLSYVERLVDGGPLLLPDGGLNSWGFLWVADIADTVAANLGNAASFGNTYNLAQREVVSLRQLLETSAAELGQPVRFVSVPGELLERVGLGTAFSPFSHDHDIILDSTAAHRDLLFEPTPFATWCPRLVAECVATHGRRRTSFYATRTRELQLVQELANLRLLPPQPPRPATTPPLRLRRRLRSRTAMPSHTA
ncbi:MAG: NAD-dependent epimerase/dehydratase family protein [Thermoanaerobaculaceae bacterium]|jgi:nucleoside-diphosphate-sugar epimerase|nr:NAD-dependent epimerase/dehydratase family protein [Thermoanaerobaculaceae bacterium]